MMEILTSGAISHGKNELRTHEPRHIILLSDPPRTRLRGPQTFNPTYFYAMSAVGGSTGSEPSHASSSSSSRKPTVAETVKPRLVKQGTRATEASSSEEINRIWELRKKGRTGPEWTVHEVTLDNMAEVVVDLQSKHSTDWILYQIPGIETDFALGPPPLAVHERRAKEMLDLLKRIGGDGTKQVSFLSHQWRGCFFHRN